VRPARERAEGKYPEWTQRLSQTPLKRPEKSSESPCKNRRTKNPGPSPHVERKQSFGDKKGEAARGGKGDVFGGQKRPAVI